MLKKFLARSEGQGLVEYALILVLVAVVVVSTLALLGPAVGNIFDTVVEYFVTEPGDPPPECYGSLLLPIMVGTAGLGIGLSYLWPKQPEPQAGA
jgi:pilus assembly protein Flp/PilA